jgi:hypothetical protein
VRNFAEGSLPVGWKLQLYGEIDAERMKSWIFPFSILFTNYTTILGSRAAQWASYS